MNRKAEKDMEMEKNKGKCNHNIYLSFENPKLYCTLLRTYTTTSLIIFALPLSSANPFNQVRNVPHHKVYT